MIDISDMLDSWSYDSDEINVRRIMGVDGREKYQMRLALGVLQMEVEGRPDGLSPNGCESLLEYYAEELKEQGDDFCLNSYECGELRAEATMYYHRYLSAFLLEDYEITCRDTHRNLRLFDLLGRYAEEDKDREACEGYRPYVLRMNASARAQLDIRAKDFSHASAVVKQTMEQIKEFYRKHSKEDEISTSRDLEALRIMADNVREMISASPEQKIIKQIQQAVQEERYEDAALLRDQLGQ